MKDMFSLSIDAIGFCKMVGGMLIAIESTKKLLETFTNNGSLAKQKLIPLGLIWVLPLLHIWQMEPLISTLHIERGPLKKFVERKSFTHMENEIKLAD